MKRLCTMNTYSLVKGPVLVTGLLILVTLCFYWLKKNKSHDLPPGPPAWPIIGNISQISRTGRERVRSIAKMVEKYGSNGMATIYLGSKPIVFITKFETIKQVLNDDNFSGRPFFKQIDSIFHRKGLLFTDGELWKEQRRFALSTLRDFGMGKTWLQDLIMEEAQELVQDLKNTNMKPVNPSNYFSPSVSNVICAISYGQRFSHKDEKFRRLTSLMSENNQLAEKMRTSEVFPFLLSIPFLPFRKRFLAVQNNYAEVTKFFKSLVDEHKSDLHDGEPRDYLHAFMLESEKQKDKTNSSFTSDQLDKSILNLFGAGTETTSTTLSWAIVYLLENPAVHDQVLEEVDRVVGEGSYPTLDQKDKLPFTQATIFEVQRLANLVPMALRRTMASVKLNGFNIPAGTTVSPLLMAVHENPQYFQDPLVFHPQRFLDESGALLRKVEAFMPFSIGKRFCLGESLAKMELYIFFISIVKNFRFRLPPGQTLSSSASTMSIVNSPKPYQVIFEQR